MFDSISKLLQCCNTQQRLDALDSITVSATTAVAMLMTHLTDTLLLRPNGCVPRILTWTVACHHMVFL